MEFEEYIRMIFVSIVWCTGSHTILHISTALALVTQSPSCGNSLRYLALDGSATNRRRTERSGSVHLYHCQQARAIRHAHNAYTAPKRRRVHAEAALVSVDACVCMSLDQ
jgi:hypothetical protein